MSRDVRPVSTVPAAVLALLAGSLAAQIALQATRDAGIDTAAPLPPAPGADALRLASFGEPEAAARLAMVHVQTYRSPDYRRLIDWLESILALDPRSQYPLFSAARVYAETADPARSRLMLAHAALIAKHRLKDLPLALRYAQALERHAGAADLPHWARQMEIFILEDMNELEAARVMIAGLLASGTLHDPAEVRFLKQRLDELEARLAAGER